jgi:cytoskeletal protein RodZ
MEFLGFSSMPRDLRRERESGMRKSIVSVLSIVVVLVVASGVALAQTPSYTPPAQTPPQTQPAQTPAQPSQTPATQPAQTAPSSTGQMPSVSSLKPFTIEANFMSLAGYLRYLMHQQTGQWMTYAEAQRAVKQGQ